MALAGREVIVLEAEPEIGMHTPAVEIPRSFTRVPYYHDDSLKARPCVKGKELIYQYCDNRNIPHQRIGKVIVSLYENEIVKLKAIHAQAMKNGVDDLSMLDQSRMQEIEPS